MIFPYTWNAALKWSARKQSNSQRWNTDTEALEVHNDANWSEYLTDDVQVGTSASRHVTIDLPDDDYVLEGYDENNADLGDVPDREEYVSVRDGERVVASSTLNSNVLQWNSTAVPTPDTAGYPKVTIKSGTGTGEISLTSGKAAATIAAGDMAADSITASALATDAVTKIQNGLATTANQLTITPILATATNPRYSTRDLPPIAQGSAPQEVFVIVDADGNAVSLSGKTVRMVVYTTTSEGDDEDSLTDNTIEAEYEYETGGSGITVGGASNNQVTVQHDDDNTAIVGDYHYFLWNITDNIVLAKGSFQVEPAAKTA